MHLLIFAITAGLVCFSHPSINYNNHPRILAKNSPNNRIYASTSPQPTNFQSWSLLRNPKTSTCEITDISNTQQFNRRLHGKTRVRMSMRRNAELWPRNSSNAGTCELEYIKIVGPADSVPEYISVNGLCVGDMSSPNNHNHHHNHDAAAKPIVQQIINNGPPTNRIDVVFMGDGYTRQEESKFFADMRRLTNEMWNGGVFDHVLPMYNVWAVFVPSRESGIGVGGVAKDTAFGLYRDGTELRGVYPSKPQAARDACKSTGLDACDFPTLIANDKYYGGLGGEFTIATASRTTGTVVLRHEFGHTMIDVGEEYDGGQVYSGCNAAHSLENVGWKEWLTDESGLREEKGVQLIQDYSWYNLANGPYILNFTSTGAYSRWILQITASGVDIPNSLRVSLDGEPLEWKPHGNLDRGFYEWSGDKGFEAGVEHWLQFEQGVPREGEDAPIRQLCSVGLHEYAGEDEYHFDPEYVGAFPTFSIYGAKSYRPTHETCLMRNMTSTHFCPVCKEGLFLQLLKGLSLIDAVDTTCTIEASNTENNQQHYKHVARLQLLPLAHLREPEKRIPGEKYIIRWFRDGVVQRGFNDLLEAVVIGDGVEGKWSVRVRIETPFVRKTDEEGIFTSEVAVDWSLC